MNPDRQEPLFAAAVKAEPGDAPRLVGSATGKLAERIVEVARENGIPVAEDKDLARSLRLLEVGAILPEELYPVVAEIIAHVYRISRQGQTGE